MLKSLIQSVHWQQQRCSPAMLALLLIALMCGSAAAQSSLSDTVPITWATGARVRLKMVGSRQQVYGVLVGASDTVITVRSSGVNLQLRPPAILAADKSFGSPRRVYSSVGLGIVGAVVGVVVGYKVPAGGASFEDREASRDANSLIGLVIGAVGGAVLGAAIVPEIWQPLRLPR